MMKNYSKRFRSTNAFFNSSAIIHKLIRPKKKKLVLQIFFSKASIFSSKNVGGTHN